MAGSTKKAHIIFHIDMNSFYASVEIARHPDWKGKPLAIAGRPEERHGIVVTSSYEARKMGVRTTMTVQEARRKCPQLIIKEPDFVCYRSISDQLFQMLKSYTPIVEKASIDEGYMDVSELYGSRHPLVLAEELQHRILIELQLPCSIGIAPNKFLAKMASNMKKPMGITVLRKRDLPEKMWPLPIGKMHGVGPRTAKRFKRIGIHTIGDLAKSDIRKISSGFGLPGRKLHEKANGWDNRSVDPEAWDRYKSIGHSLTLTRDTRSIETIRRTIDQLSEKLAAKLKREHVVSYELTVMIRYRDWQTVTRHLTTVQPLHEKKEIMNHALELFRAHWSGKSVRLLGVTLAAFQPVAESTKQLDLFSYKQDAKNESLVNIIEQINDKFGKDALRPAARLRDFQKKKY
ncbi:DNA polymerase IV [Sporolactobacillus sp. THM7-4]|nr:DNA polymerase IV [Sporolactobacillus sp. THM7-4]